MLALAATRKPRATALRRTEITIIQHAPGG
jgi:hypothetical protein